MRSRAGLRFLAITTLLIGARALDAWTTWVATPNLMLEQNPLERLLHVGWAGLLLLNAAVVVLLAIAAWKSIFAPAALPPDAGLDLPGFVGRYWFSRAEPRSIGQAMFWLPADRKVRWAFVGGPGALLVIVASVVVAGWNLLVAKHIVRSPVAGRIWITSFWIAIMVGLGVSVRAFLLHAYARYRVTRA